MTAAVRFELDLFIAGASSWRQLRKSLVAWQAGGLAVVELAGVPVDLVSLATAEPTQLAGAEIAVRASNLLHHLRVLEAHLRAQDPPTPPDRPIGS